MKVFEWRITDNIAELTPEELENEPLILGFLKFTLGNINIGYIIEDDCIEGDQLILDWIGITLECANTVKHHKNFEHQLYSYNLLKVKVEYGDPISVKLVDDLSETVDSEAYISLADLVSTAIRTADEFLDEIKSKNKALMNTKPIKRITELRDSINM